MGIPDEPSFRSPGRHEESIEYFPCFGDGDERHTFHLRKMAFGFYSDTFFYKMFSTLESVGHLLNKRFSLKLKEEEVSFHRAISRLEKEELDLINDLKVIRNGTSFKLASEYRHAITHRHPPSDFTSGIEMSENGVSGGVGEYTDCATVLRIMDGGIETLTEVLHVLKSCDNLATGKSTDLNSH